MPSRELWLELQSAPEKPGKKKVPVFLFMPDPVSPRTFRHPPPPQFPHTPLIFQTRTERPGDWEPSPRQQPVRSSSPSTSPSFPSPSIVNSVGAVVVGGGEGI